MKRISFALAIWWQSVSRFYLFFVFIFLEGGWW